MRLHATRIVCAALLAIGCGLAIGASKTTALNVSATVVGSCFISLASTMAFGNYVAGAGDIDQTSTIAVGCTSGTPYGIGLSTGTGAGSTISLCTSRHLPHRWKGSYRLSFQRPQYPGFFFSRSRNR